MTSSFPVPDIESIVAVLESRIQANIVCQTITPPTIRCRFQQRRLLVLAEDDNAAVTAHERNQCFKALARATHTALMDAELVTGLEPFKDALSVRLYLRQRGTASPYAVRNWAWKPAAPAPRPGNPAVVSTVVPEIENSVANPMSGGALVVLAAPTNSEARAVDDLLFSDIYEPKSVTPLTQHWQVVASLWADWPWRSVLGLVAVGLTVGGVIYGLSRPCLIGPCDRRQTASDLHLAALNQVDSQPTLQDIQTAHEDLQQAVNLLSGIPPWSPHYSKAQVDLRQYQAQLAEFGWVIAAQKSATTAAERSQDPPHPVPVWVEVHLLWQKAVTDLQRIPPESPLAEFAAIKLQEYRTNHETIGQRLVVEEAAEAHLNESIQAGQLAAAQAAKATTSSDWELVHQEWRRAVNALSRIPQGTLAHTEARSLQEDYRIQLVRTRMRVSVERAGNRAYQTALALADDAQAAEQANQWGIAVQTWQQAIIEMRKVPRDIATYAEAQDTLQHYQVFLERAQGELKRSVALQGLEDDLDALCPNEEGICTFSYTTQEIELTVWDPYDSAIRQSISPPSSQNNLSQAAAIVERTHQLVQDIMQTGNRVSLPIAVYDRNRRLVARYQPQYGGFQK
ncbi:MAG: hypothetical protein AAGH78_14115 [Cyanobacteria bacterium P01_H01_bin.58]